MTREKGIAWLKDVLGIEEPTKAQVSALLNHDRDVEVEVTERVTNEVKESYKDYKSSEDYKKLEDEIATLKDESKRAERNGKYKSARIKEKWFDHADSKLKDSTNFDEDLKKYLADYPELLESDNNPAPKKKEDSFESNKGNNSENKSSFDKAWEEAHPELKN